MKKFVAIMLVLMMAMAMVPAMAATTVSDLAELKAALAAGETAITIDGVIEVTSNVTLKASKETTITTSVTDVFTVKNGATLTLGENLSIEGTSSILFAENGTINIDGAEIYCTSASSYNAGCVYNGAINVKSGLLMSENSASTIQAKGSGASVTVSGGVVVSTASSTLFANKGGKVVVSGGEVYATCKTPQFIAIYAENASEIVVTGGVVRAYGAGVDANNGSSAVISGGMVLSEDTDAVSDDGNNSSVTVRGGVFSDDSAKKYFVPGLTYGYYEVDGMEVYGPVEVIPETGDEATIILWSAMILLAGAALLVMKKKSYNY